MQPLWWCGGFHGRKQWHSTFRAIQRSWSHYATLTLVSGASHFFPFYGSNAILKALPSCTNSRVASRDLFVKNGVWRPPAVVWSHWATLTLLSAAGSILPLDTLSRFPSCYVPSINRKSRIPKPPFPKWRRCSFAVARSHWATRTLCSVAVSIIPLETARTLSKWVRGSNGSRKPTLKSFPVKNGVGVIQLSYGRTGRR